MRYVLRSVASGKYIAVDSSSGGYPYEVDDIWRAKFFESPIDAVRYTAVMSWANYDRPVFSMEAVSLVTEPQVMPTGDDLAATRK